MLGKVPVVDIRRVVISALLVYKCILNFFGTLNWLENCSLCTISSVAAGLANLTALQSCLPTK